MTFEILEQWGLGKTNQEKYKYVEMFVELSV